MAFIAGLVLKFNRAVENRVGTFFGEILRRTHFFFSSGKELKPMIAEGSRFGAMLLVRG